MKGRDSLKALLNAMRFEMRLKNLKTPSFDIDKPLTHPVIAETLAQSREWTDNNFPHFVAKLDARDWKSESLIFSDRGYRAFWL